MPPSTSITGRADQRQQALDLVRRGGDEGLAAPAGVDGHAEDEVGGAAQLGDRLDRGAGVDRDPGQAAELADRVQGAVGVRGRLGVEGDRVGAGLGELLDLALRRLDHQVDVDRAAGGVDLVGDRAERPAARS